MAKKKIPTAKNKEKPVPAKKNTVPKNKTNPFLIVGMGHLLMV